MRLRALPPLVADRALVTYSGGSIWWRSRIIRSVGSVGKPVPSSKVRIPWLAHQRTWPTQSFEPIGLVPSQPRMHRLPRDTPLLRDLADRSAIGDHREYGLILLLHHAHLHQHGMSVKNQPEPPSSMYRSHVKHEPEPDCQE
jgi:hypothetical protein